MAENLYTDEDNNIFVTPIESIQYRAGENITISATGTLTGDNKTIEVINYTISGKNWTPEIVNTVESGVSGKQDILTFGYDNNAISAINGSALAGKTYSAGDNIDITNDVISVTGLSTYTPGQMIQIKNDVIDIKNNNCSATGNFAVAIGFQTFANGPYSYAEGDESIASGKDSHAEGEKTSAFGTYSHAEGQRTLANKDCTHAEGCATSALGHYSHAEGYTTIASGDWSHAEGFSTIATKDSHAEGYATSAIGKYTHAEGQGTIAAATAMHVGGTYNKTSADALFVIGNGIASTRSDAFVIYPNGSVSVAGNISANGVELGAGTTYTAGNNIDITNDVISVTGLDAYITSADLINNIAKEYDPNKEYYRVGSLVMHDNQLYQAQYNTQSGAFNPIHWSATNVDNVRATRLTIYPDAGDKKYPSDEEVINAIKSRSLVLLSEEVPGGSDYGRPQDFFILSDGYISTGGSIIAKFVRDIFNDDDRTYAYNITGGLDYGSKTYMFSADLNTNSPGVWTTGINKIFSTDSNYEYITSLYGYPISATGGGSTGDYVPLSAFNAAIGTNNTAESTAFAQGINNIANSNGAAIGNSTTAYNNSFAQGSYCNATYSSFAQGANSTASSASFVQGVNCNASEYSFAQGSANTATNTAASFGVQNYSNYKALANGNQSTAQYESIANGNKAYAYNQSLAIGQNVHAYDRSIAVGTYCTADYSCFAQGYGNELAANKISAYDYSFAHGYMGVTASEYSLAQGNHSYAYNNSLAQGSKVSADRYSFAQGGNSYCIATLASIAQGQDNKSDTYSQALGQGNIASSYCFAAGQNNNSSAFSFAQGQNNTATSTGFAAGASNSAYNKAFTQGENCTAKNNSIAQGEYCEAYDSAQAFGNHVKISAGMAIGNYNKTSANAAFVIGNGANNANRSDLFLISANGVASGSDFTTNGVSLSGMLVLYNALTARPLTGSYTLKCVDGVLTWESEVPSNAISVNNEQVGVNNEGFGINDNPSPILSYNYIILQNFLDGHTIGTPVSDSDHSDFYNTYPADLSTLWYTPEDWSNTNLVSTTAGDQLLYSDNSFDFSKYGLTAGQVPFGFCKGYDIYDGAGYANITLPSSWTLETWFYSPLGDGEYTDPFWGSFFEIGPSYPNLLRLYVETNSIALFAMDNDVLSVSKTVTNQEWHHVALSCDGTNLYLFYDGELLGTVAIASVSGLSTMLASAVKVMVNVDSNGNGSNELWYAQLALCDECKWTDDFVPPKYAY